MRLPVTVLVGLALTAALGLMMVGALNLISVYFAVLFVGIGVDFGIQFSVRYRAERHEIDDLRGALKQAGRFVGAPLTLAATATAAGFLSFLPTDYRGVSELGLIAGFGMLIAFATSVSLLPALIRLLGPPGEPEALAVALNLLLRDPDRAEAMGQAGRKRAVAEFGWSAIAAQTADLYAELVHSGLKRFSLPGFA